MSQNGIGNLRAWDFIIYNAYTAGDMKHEAENHKVYRRIQEEEIAEAEVSCAYCWLVGYANQYTARTPRGGGRRVRRVS
jgi:hypothetical protein